MNKICKEYISQINSLFPIYRKTERAYLNKLMADVVDFCEENNITSIDELYLNYGTPEDVVHNYVSAIDRKVLVKHINTRNLAKIAVAAILIAVTTATTIWGIYTINLIEIAQRQEVVIVEETIQYYN